MATTPVFLPEESPWTEEPGGLQSTGSQRVGHDLVGATKHSTAQHNFNKNKKRYNETGRLLILSVSIPRRPSAHLTDACI